MLNHSISAAHCNACTVQALEWYMFSKVHCLIANFLPACMTMVSNTRLEVGAQVEVTLQYIC